MIKLYPNLKINFWTLVHKVKGRKWLCRCDCGKEKIVDTYPIKKGKSKSCGCHRKILFSQEYREDLTGKIFGRLTVLNFHSSKNSKPRWLCLCVCGKTKVVTADNLRRDITKSCGCLHKEISNKIQFKKGSLHPRYDASISDEDRKYKRRDDKVLKNFMKMVFLRDNYTCYFCKTKGDKLNIHHINNWKYYKDIRYDINNGICLCEKCHKAFHSFYGYSVTQAHFNSYLNYLNVNASINQLVSNR